MITSDIKIVDRWLRADPLTEEYTKVSNLYLRTIKNSKVKSGTRIVAKKIDKYKCISKIIKIIN